MTTRVLTKPILQVALDFLELKRAMQVAREAVRGGAEWLEAGTPLIKSEGLDSIRELRREFPKHTIIADLKTMDAGRVEMEAAAKAGANIGTVLAAGSESTLRECLEAGRNYGLDIMVDLLGVSNPIGLARLSERLGAHHVGIHVAIDEQMEGKDPLELLRRVREAVSLPISVAGGIHSELAPQLVEAGADILVVGGAISKSEDAEGATRILRQAIETGKAIRTELYQRQLPIRELLEKASTPNLSDAMHRCGDIPGLEPIVRGVKMVGPAFTVRAYPGDWAKPVEAIEFARPGDVIVIDAGGVGPALWGELASEGAVQSKLAGVVVYGAIRDVESIRELSFPSFASLICPTAGEPKGFGELGVTVKVGPVEVSPGDWIVGDDNGVVRVPERRAMEFANRAMDVLEKENRLRQEIRRGSNLAEVAELLRWEKKIAT